MAAGKSISIARMFRRRDPLRRLSLLSNFGMTMLGVGTYSLAQIATLILLEWSGGTRTVGVYAAALAIANPLMMFSLFNLRLLQVTDPETEDDFSTYWTFRVITSVLLAAVCLVIAPAYDGVATEVLSWLGISKALEAISDLIHGEFQRLERMDFVAGMLVLRSIVAPACLTCGLVCYQDLAWGVMLSTIVSAVILAGWEFPALMSMRKALGRGPLGLNWNDRKLSTIFSWALPLTLLATCNGLQQSIPRLVVNEMVGGDYAGIYAGIGSLAVAGTLILAALMQAGLPRLVRALAEDDQPVIRRLLRSYSITGLLCAASVIGVMTYWGPWLIGLTFGSAYTAYPLAVVLIAAGQASQFLSLPAGLWLRARRSFRPVVACRLISTGLHLGLSIFAVRQWGLLGAAGAYCVSELVDAGLILLSAAWLARSTSRLDSPRIVRVGHPEPAIGRAA